MKEVPMALSIAGTDPTGGAGIHADLKTFQECDTYGMAVVTSVVSQNTEGVRDVWHVPVELIKSQLNAVFEDTRPQAVKTGMLATPEIINSVADRIEAEKVPLVVDPVMVATSGDSLMEEETEKLMRTRLLPLATIITPNKDEAEKLIGQSISSLTEAKEAARHLVEELGAGSALVKGGHFSGDATDILYAGNEFYYFSAPRTETNHTHGTGCTLSAAIAAKLARGYNIADAVDESKQFITEAISQPLGIGKGNGPVNHFASRLTRDELFVERRMYHGK
ncbi:bifunctional hydroxymethylpyrimidine kinase/phosphomethylpyrimidine kinase [Alteribacillus iranensis]|uniref:Hydroxymethylpyrimidine/phosphomethylpyrimidine kinase n=1 Tax=Alteribacillus iranensis TaxID=930128 RepID=A0A1I2DFT9_9BACI|nr:bifunctional hydroxymethylpyrimidine kinase/phosphomethylpyrimidine kinase [Alteribacillus iranensis]SFE79475.1 hydroxymethylpyrimidine/phosphomethylpyrimidine kinase [Alteribacillus iranensis]